MNNEERYKILKEALTSGYKGSIGDLIKQQEMQVAQTPEEQAQGLRGQPHGSSMSFPNSSGDFNTMGMTHPIDITKVDEKGNIVQSYKSVPPGIENIPMGGKVGTVIETPGTYQGGGFPNQVNTNYQESQNYQRIRNSRKGVRKNPDDSHSTHLMADNNKDEAWPTLFQSKDGSWFEPINAYEEAKRRGEIYKFDSKEELINFARKGDWKDTYQGGVQLPIAEPDTTNVYQQNSNIPIAKERPWMDQFGSTSGSYYDPLVGNNPSNQFENQSPYELVTGYLEKTDRNMDYVNTVMTTFGQYESKNDITQKQISGYNKDGSIIYGPGRGKYQYEIGKEASGNTAVNRTYKLFKEKLNINFKDSNLDPELKLLYKTYKGKSADISIFSEEMQNIIFLADNLYGDSSTDFSNLLKSSRKEGPSIDEMFNVWGKHHKAEFIYKEGKKKVSYTFDKLPKDKRAEELKKFKKRTSVKKKLNNKQKGGYRRKYQGGGNEDLLLNINNYQPNVSQQDNTYRPPVTIPIIEEEEQEKEEKTVFKTVDNYNKNENSTEEITSTTKPILEFDLLPTIEAVPNSTYVYKKSIIEYDHDLVESDSSEINKTLTDNIQQNQKIRAEKKVQDNIKSVMNNYYKKYNTSNEDDVIKIQQEIVDYGFGDMLGKYGPNKDGIDGKFGPSTKAAYEAVMMDKMKSKRSLYFDPANRESFCTEEGCAEYVNNEFENEGYNAWDIGVGGHAWTMHKNILDAGGVTKFNIYSHSDFDNVSSPSDAREKSIKHRRSNKPDKSQLSIGDVVGLVYDRSGSWGDAYSGHSGKSYNTHVGFVSGFKNGKPIISHNVHRRVHNDPYDKITGGGIAWVATPSVGTSQYKYEYSEEEENHDNSEQIAFLEEKRERYDDKGNLVPFTEEQKVTMSNNIDFIKNNTSKITKDLGIEIDNDWLAETVTSISMVETGLGISTKDETDIKNSRIQRGLLNIAVDFGNIMDGLVTGLDKLLGGNSTYSHTDSVKTDSGSISRGVNNIKTRGLSPGSASYYGLNEGNIDTDPKRSLAYTTDRLARNYAVINNYAKKNPKLGLTEEDVRNMTILTHPQGTGKLFNFGSNPYMTLDEQLVLLRGLYKGATTDLDSTDYGSVEYALGPDVANLVRTLFGSEDDNYIEYYISKVNRITNREKDKHIEKKTEEEPVKYDSYMPKNII